MDWGFGLFCLPFSVPGVGSRVADLGALAHWVPGAQGSSPENTEKPGSLDKGGWNWGRGKKGKD